MSPFVFSELAELECCQAFLVQTGKPDSRYRYFRLHPFSLRELSSKPSGSDLDALLKFGGFPEPLFTQHESEHRIWQRDRLSRVVREDLRDLEQVREISLVEHLADMLPGLRGKDTNPALLSGRQPIRRARQRCCHSIKCARNWRFLE